MFTLLRPTNLLFVYPKKCAKNMCSKWLFFCIQEYLNSLVAMIILSELLLLFSFLFTFNRIHISGIYWNICIWVLGRVYENNSSSHRNSILTLSSTSYLINLFKENFWKIFLFSFLLLLPNNTDSTGLKWLFNKKTIKSVKRQFNSLIIACLSLQDQLPFRLEEILRNKYY